jgi:hypothetical protein
MYCIRDTIIEIVRTYSLTDVNMILLAVILAVVGLIVAYLVYVKILIPKLKDICKLSQ